MEALTALGGGLLLRLAIPILITALVVYFLKKLDERWQAEGEMPIPSLQKPECWQIKNCPIEMAAACPGYLSPLPCWQVFRLPNGYLRERCLSCEVFRGTPFPAPTSQQTAQEEMPHVLTI